MKGRFTPKVQLKRRKPLPETASTGEIIERLREDAASEKETLSKLGYFAPGMDIRLIAAKRLEELNGREHEER